MWGPRLKKSVEGFGHHPILLAKVPAELAADLAIVNLGSLSIPASSLVPKLKEAGIKVLAHAGHKEKELHELGAKLGCDRLATNSEITHKLEQILGEFAAGT